MSFKALDFAYHLIAYDRFHYNSKMPINYIKLQALMYYVQVEHITQFGEVCFDDDIYVDTNINAPYIEEIWRVLGRNIYSPIQVLGERYDVPEQYKDLESFVWMILSKTSGYDGSELYAFIRASKEFKEAQVKSHDRILLSVDRLKTLLYKQ